ncbi:hypothetical protein E2562_007092 [Oryza meyeriana var. granulata]|uniref:BHLH domain-containing protein n=1 Tax=Oryza meyeriana var. granulata TaxID=110450 RepID=A0A6G1F4S4_9ORYZ|nr:hypothetical protein E2562_007092 [Oryza meyeriana var. granulata]
MEHHHLLQLSPPPTHLMMSPGFFDVVGEVGAFGDVIVPVADAVGLEDDGRDWVEDLMHLGELFGVGGNDHSNNAAVGGDVGGDDHHQMLAWQTCEGGASPDQPSCGDGDGDGDVSPPCGELAGRDDGDNSATRKRRDRSKTIVSERKRRVRMKEKLYELRALVPNITKMDKASIIADAVVYVKGLQAHARKLKEEVAVLESRPRPPSAVRQPHRAPPVLRPEAGHHGGRAPAAARVNDAAGSRGPAAADTTHGARVTHVGAAQVGEGRFFLTVECEPAAADVGGVAAQLCAAVESLSCFTVESSTLGCSPDRIVSTLSLKVSEGEEDATMISECTVKLWVMAALLKEGFRPQPTVEIS